MDFIRLIKEAQRRWPDMQFFATYDSREFVSTVQEAQLLALSGHNIPALEDFFIFEGHTVCCNPKPGAALNTLKRQIKEAYNAA